MKNTKFARILSFILCFVLVAAMALVSVGCNDNTDTNPASGNPSSSDTASTNDNVLGEGATKFTVAITFSDGSEKTYTVNTDKKTVGEALLDEELIDIEDGMVFTVDGETVKYEDNGKYWAFYVGNDYAMTGVEATDIEAGQTYAFKVE